MIDMWLTYKQMQEITKMSRQGIDKKIAKGEYQTKTENGILYIRMQIQDDVFEEAMTPQKQEFKSELETTKKFFQDVREQIEKGYEVALKSKEEQIDFLKERLKYYEDKEKKSIFKRLFG